MHKLFKKCAKNMSKQSNFLQSLYILLKFSCELSGSLGGVNFLKGAELKIQDFSQTFQE